MRTITAEEARTISSNAIETPPISLKLKIAKIDFLIKRAAKKGLNQIRISCFSEAVIKYYESFGYRVYYFLHDLYINWKQ